MIRLIGRICSGIYSLAVNIYIILSECDISAIKNIKNYYSARILFHMKSSAGLYCSLQFTSGKYIYIQNSTFILGISNIKGDVTGSIRSSHYVLKMKCRTIEQIIGLITNMTDHLVNIAVNIRLSMNLIHELSAAALLPADIILGNILGCCNVHYGTWGSSKCQIRIRACYLGNDELRRFRPGKIDISLTLIVNILIDSKIGLHMTILF